MWNKLLSILKKGQGSHPFPKKGQQITLYLLSAAPSWKVIGRYVCSRALQTAVWVHDPMKMPNGTASWTTLSMPCWAPVSTHHGLCSAWEPGFPLALALGSPGMKPKASRVWSLQRCYWNGNDLEHCWNTEAGCHLLLQGHLPDPGIEPASPSLQAGCVQCSHPILIPGRDPWFDDKTVEDPWHLYSWPCSHSWKVLNWCICHFAGAQIWVTHLLWSESSGRSGDLVQEGSLISCYNRQSN